MDLPHASCEPATAGEMRVSLSRSRGKEVAAIRMSSCTDFLYARPSIIEGIARLLDFGNILNEYNRSRTSQEADIRALRADWYVVGDDLRRAYEEFAEECAREREREAIGELSR